MREIVENKIAVLEKEIEESNKNINALEEEIGQRQKLISDNLVYINQARGAVEALRQTLAEAQETKDEAASSGGGQVEAETPVSEDSGDKAAEA